MLDCCVCAYTCANKKQKGVSVPSILLLVFVFFFFFVFIFLFPF